MVCQKVGASNLSQGLPLFKMDYSVGFTSWTGLTMFFALSFTVLNYYQYGMKDERVSRIDRVERF